MQMQARTRSVVLDRVSGAAAHGKRFCSQPLLQRSSTEPHPTFRPHSIDPNTLQMLHQPRPQANKLPCDWATNAATVWSDSMQVAVARSPDQRAVSTPVPHTSEALKQIKGDLLVPLCADSNKVQKQPTLLLTHFALTHFAQNQRQLVSDTSSAAVHLSPVLQTQEQPSSSSRPSPLQPNQRRPLPQAARAAVQDPSSSIDTDSHHVHWEQTTTQQSPKPRHAICESTLKPGAQRSNMRRLSDGFASLSSQTTLSDTVEAGECPRQGAKMRHSDSGTDAHAWGRGMFKNHLYAHPEDSASGCLQTGKAQSLRSDETFLEGKPGSSKTASTHSQNSLQPPAAQPSSYQTLLDSRISNSKTNSSKSPTCLHDGALQSRGLHEALLAHQAGLRLGSSKTGSSSSSRDDTSRASSISCSNKCNNNKAANCEHGSMSSKSIGSRTASRGRLLQRLDGAALPQGAKGVFAKGDYLYLMDYAASKVKLHPSCTQAASSTNVNGHVKARFIHVNGHVLVNVHVHGHVPGMKAQYLWVLHLNKHDTPYRSRYTPELCSYSRP